MPRLVILMVVLTLSACSQDSVGDRGSGLEKFVEAGQIGRSADYWLVKRSMGVDDRVALVFGYWDNVDACFEIAELLNAKYPSAGFTCRNAN